MEIKIKHLVILLFPIMSIIGLINGWIKNQPDFLGLLTILSLFISFILFCIFTLKHWDEKIIKL